MASFVAYPAARSAPLAVAAIAFAVLVRGRDPPRSTPGRLRPVSELELCPRLRAGVPAHVRHHGGSAVLQPLCAVGRRARQNADRRGTVTRADVGCAVRFCASGALARDTDRLVRMMAGGSLLLRTRMLRRLGLPRPTPASRRRRLVCVPSAPGSRFPDASAPRIGLARAPADAERQGFGRPEFVQLSGRDRRRDRRRDRVRPRRVPGRARAGRVVRAADCRARSGNQGGRISPAGLRNQHPRV